jgi:hypothetical protein
MEEISINDYIRRVNSKLKNELTYTITDRDNGSKMLTVRLDNLIVLQSDLIRDGSLYYHIIPGKNIKLIYEDFM